MGTGHVPVLVEEALGFLEPERGGFFVDCTVGLGGHAEALLRSASGARLLGLDRDPQALAAAAPRLRGFGGRVRLVCADFADLGDLLAPAERRVAGVLADLGVSSLQLETPERGFSFRREGPLDMRMGPAARTAADVVNRYPEADLVRIFREYGEERQARRIARAIVESRERAPLRTTRELAQLVYRAKGIEVPRREGRVDPATRVFQAVRIEVNQELAGLETFLDAAVRLLERDGRLVVISYHSLEDRIVKSTFRDLERGEVDPVTGRPRSETRLIAVLTAKPVRPGEAEVAANPRARSARLRAARRLS